MTVLNVFQRTLESLPFRGKGRLADFIIDSFKPSELKCRPVPNATILLRPDQSIERWMWAGAYERELLGLFKTMLKPGMTVLDMGANIGYFSAVAAALVGKTGTVHAFEPVRETFTRLESNLQPFPWAHAYQAAVGDYSGTAVIHFNDRETGWGSLLANYDLPLSEETILVCLDDWLKRENVGPVDFVKIDIEGQEYRALLGGAEMLRNQRPTIAAELNDACLRRDQRRPQDVLSLLQSAEYLTFSFNNGVLAIPQENESILGRLRPYLKKPFT